MVHDDQSVSACEAGRLKTDPLLTPPHHRPQPTTTAPKRWRWSVAVCACLTMLAALAYLHFANPVCISDSCVRASSDQSRWLDRSVSPCDDFYRFACQGWINTTVSPLPTGASWHVIGETGFAAIDKVHSHIMRVISTESRLSLNLGEQSAVEFYQKCMDLPQLQKIGVDSWQELVQEMGGWNIDDPSLPTQALETTILQSYQYASYPVFWAGVAVDHTTPDRYIITIDEQLPILIFAESYVEKNEPLTVAKVLQDNITIHMHLLKQSGLHLAGLAGNEMGEEAQIAFAEMMVLEWKLVLISSVFEAPGAEKATQLYHVTTLHHLKRTMPMISWSDVLSTLLGFDVRDNEPIAIKPGMRWLTDLNSLITEYSSTHTGRRTLENYIKWKTLFIHFSYVETNCGQKKNDMFEILLQMYKGMPIMRKNFCNMRTSGHFPLSLSSILRKADGSIADENKAVIERMGATIKEVYMEELTASELFDNVTRQHVMNKLNNTVIFASFPDDASNDALMRLEGEQFPKDRDFFWSSVIAARKKFQRDLSRLRSPVKARSWVDNVNGLSINAIHNYERNVVMVPFVVARDRLMDATKPSFANFASIGMIIGHEITHAFDNQGRYFGANASSKWGKDSIARFDEKTQCFVDQYAALKNPDAPDPSTSKKTLYENLADNVGLRVAYKAWQRWDELGRERLPGTDFTPQQAFFISFAQTWCSTNGIQRGVHSDEELRVKGPLQNMPEFSHAFSCPLGSPMNPADKCQLW